MGVPPQDAGAMPGKEIDVEVSFKGFDRITESRVPGLRLVSEFLRLFLAQRALAVHILGTQNL
jgi:hypothetical protein